MPNVSSTTMPGAERAERLVLDTSAYSHFRRGHDEVLDAIATAEIVVLPATVLGELAAAFEHGHRTQENRTVLAQFLDEPFVVSQPVTDAVAQRYGMIHAQLRRSGQPIPVNDIWIAAATFDCGGHLLTFDQGFARIDGLACSVLSVP